MNPTDGRTRWAWPWILAIPAAGLVLETVVMADSFSAGDDSALANIVTGLLFWGWAALPFVGVGVLMRVAVGRNRVAWWLSLAAGAAASLYGVWFTVDYLHSGSSTAALAWIFGPLAQLTVVGGFAAAILPLSLTSRQRPVRS